MSNLLQIDGLPIIDAKRPLTLTITETDIAKANTKAPNGCAVARACARQLHVKEARVHLGRIYLRTNDSNWVRYQTPNRLRSEIIAFDRGGRFAAGDYHMRQIAPSQRANGKRQGGNMDAAKDATRRKATRKTPNKRAPYHLVTDVRGGPA